MFSNTSKVNLQNNLVQSSITAYIFHQGQWHTGFINYSTTQNGYKLTTYQFNTISSLQTGQKLVGHFYDDTKFTNLNPNNNLARQHNFTHYVSIEGFNAYIISN